MTPSLNQVDDKTRFRFGENWRRYSRLIDADRITKAELSLRRRLATDSLEGKSFIDIGCGSGLFSLAARRLGARVYSFDYDRDSVSCTEELRRRYFPNDSGWHVERGSILDQDYLASLGLFDVVYSWGVLHHTGRMWHAIANTTELVDRGGKLFLSIYNDQGRRSIYWRWIKRNYSRRRPFRYIAIVAHLPYPFGASLAYRALTGRLKDKERGMSYWYDYLDWLGGYPFEVGKPEEVERFCGERGFNLVNRTVTNRIGPNEFVFDREI